MEHVKRTSDFLEEVHVYEPHKASLPPLGPYVREFWRRRRFAYEISRTTQKASNFETALGTVWVVLNPLMLAFVYYLLIIVLGGTGGKTSAMETLLHVVAGIFTWFYAQNAISLGAVSVTMGGKLILNQAFPRALLPFSSVISAVFMYLPSIPVYLAIYFIIFFTSKSGVIPALNGSLVLLPLYLITLTVAAYGLAMIFATMTVYFRDTSRFLGYLMRIWLYASPVLYPVSKLLSHGTKGKVALYGNPLGTMMAGITEIWEGQWPPMHYLEVSAFWALLCLVIGAWLFISRERDFAVRL